MRAIHILASFVPVSQVLASDSYEGTSAAAQFDNPPNEYRPKFRYWLPDASVAQQSVEDDIRQIAAVGGGGLEFLGFYNYGRGPALTDWSTYGFGTDAFNSLLQAALTVSAALKLKFDFALGPNQGAGVPSAVSTSGLAKHLVYGNTTVESGSTFSGKIPAAKVNFNQLTDFINPAETWGPNELIAVVAGKIIFETSLTEQFSVSNLDASSLVDLSNRTANGTLTWTAPVGNGTWNIWAFYERYTNQRSCASIAHATTVIGNGSWVVDHWSANGAKKTTDFWDQQILSNDKIAALVKETGGYAWEDSMELNSAVPWTTDFITRFETLHGYSIVPYLPLLFHATNAWGGYLPPYNITYTLGGYPADGGPYVQDYKTTLTQGYLEYLDHYRQWAVSRGVQSSSQPAYNMPLDMIEAIPHVAVPELESLGFEDNIDAYRQFTGPAHFSNRNIISTEIGAVRVGAYRQSIPSLKNLFDNSFAAGINKMVIHGYAYSGEYVGTTWPGYTPFQYEFTEMWNPRQPAWKHLDDFMAYSARNSLMMRSGIPKIDLAFYYFELGYKVSTIYPEADMNQHGYTYEYLSGKNLVSEHAVVIEGVLAPDGPAYKALVIYNQTQITPEASAALLTFASEDLPIYIVGAVPNTTVGVTGQQQVTQNMKKLVTYETVKVMSTSNFSASVLASDGVSSRATVNSASDASGLYTFWTSDTEAQSDSVYMYNKGATADIFDITFSIANDQAPYIFDAWTGSQVPLAVYERTDNSINLRIELGADQTTIVGLLAYSDAQARKHVTAHSPNVKTVRATTSGDLEALVSDTNSTAWVTLSNGTTVTLPAARSTSCQPSSTNLSNWTLSIDSYGPDLTFNSVVENITTIDVGQLDRLVPWNQISGLEHVSGIGTYLTSFTLPSISQDTSTFEIHFGPVLHTMRAWLNDQRLPAIDPSRPIVDVSGLLVAGENVLKVEVTSTLFNAVKANIEQVKSIGVGPNTPATYVDAEWAGFGLLGPVEVMKFRKVQL